MKGVRALAVLGLGAMLFFNHAVQAATWSVSDFLKLGDASYSACKIEALFDIRGSALGVPGTSGTADHISKDKERMAEAFKSVMSQQSGDDLKKSIKAYYVYWLTAMDGIPPQLEERKFQYESRQQINEQKLKELANSVRVDAAL